MTISKFLIGIKFFHSTSKAFQLKNAIYPKDESLKQQYQDRWLSMAEDVRAYIRNNCLDTLGSETKRPSQAAQCVGYIACAELPRMLWPDCISRAHLSFFCIISEK